jgi:hypothetical protein
MKPLFFLSVLILFTACKKEKTETYTPVTYSNHDFALVPTKDAKWYVHVITDNNCFPNQDPTDMDITDMNDTLWHIYHEIEALGRNTIMGEHTYHIYSWKRTVKAPYWDEAKPLITTSLYYLREDTIRQRLYCGYSPDSAENEYYLVADFSDNVNKGIVKPFPAWREVNIMQPGGLVLAGTYFKTWDMQNIVDSKLQYFYKGIGIGNCMGILSYNNPESSYLVNQTMSLDFVYKGDSIHFDYPLQ